MIERTTRPTAGGAVAEEESMEELESYNKKISDQVPGETVPGHGGPFRNYRGELTIQGAVERRKSIERFWDIFESFWNSQEFAGYRIPGTGPAGGRCQEWRPVGFCEECGYVAVVNGTCRRAECPRCEGRWRFARVESILERLLSFKYERRAGGEEERILHCVVSPSESWDGDMSELHREARELSREKGLHGRLNSFIRTG